MRQFKPECLALICGAKNSNINGMVVRLIAYIGDLTGDTVSVGGTTWEVSPKSPNRTGIWHVVGENQKAQDRRGNLFEEFPCPEKYLIPLSGDFAPEQQKLQEVSA